MKDENKSGGAAFPNARYNNIPGMTLRDYFAAKAMAAMCTFEIDGIFDGTRNDQMTVAKAAYLIADAMLEVRK